MIQLLGLLCGAPIGLLRSSARREAEILVLRHQINVLRRKSPNRPALSNVDRLLFVLLSRLVPSILDALTVIRPATVIRWHRAGFRAYWRWKSRPRGGRPRMSHEIRQLVRDLSLANPLWGAPRIHGELLKLGIDVGQTTVAKYMAKRRRPPPQGWRAFLRNHADGIASMDLFVVPTISFRLTLWIADNATRSPPNPMARRHRAPDGRMDRTPALRVPRLGSTTAIHRP